MTDVVSFRLAKLLKEKLFGLNKDDYIQLPRFYKKDGNYVEYEVHVGKTYNNCGYLGGLTIEDFQAHLTMMDNSLDDIYLAPTIAEAVMWLYDKHDIWINSSMSFEEFVPYIQCNWNYRQDSIIKTLEFMKSRFTSPTEAYRAAIEYTLKELI